MAVVADSAGPVSAHVWARLEERLNERRVVVWYDGHGAFAALAAALDRPGTVVVGNTRPTACRSLPDRTAVSAPS